MLQRLNKNGTNIFTLFFTDYLIMGVCSTI